MSAAARSKPPDHPRGHSTWAPRKTARFRITPHTTAVIAVSGPVKAMRPRVDSTSGPPARMKTKDGRNVNQVATSAHSTPAA